MHIEVYGPDGVRHCITSSVPATVGAWIMETFQELATSGWDLYKYPPRFAVWPSWNPVTNEADWIQDTRVITQGFTASTPTEFADGLFSQIQKANELKAT